MRLLSILKLSRWRRADADTLYSPAWVYAKEQPIIITVPKIPGNRYFAIELAGFDSDNFAYISRRFHGNGGGNYAIVPPMAGGLARRR